VLLICVDKLYQFQLIYYFMYNTSVFCSFCICADKKHPNSGCFVSCWKYVEK